MAGWMLLLGGKYLVPLINLLREADASRSTDPLR